MKSTKFTINSLLIVIAVISALGLFITVKAVNMADRIPVNDIFPIEGTDLSIRYSSLEKNGIYKGGENTGKLMLEGTFGYEWGAVKVGDTLYANEFSNTDLGLVLSNVVKINTVTFEKEILYKNMLLRGQCKSGELVCVANYIMPSNYPETNSLMKLYTIRWKSSSEYDEGSEIRYIEPESAETVFWIKGVEIDDNFEKEYLDKTLEEAAE